MNKMSKSTSAEANMTETSLQNKIVVLESEVKYWKVKYELFLKYGNVDKNGELG